MEKFLKAFTPRVQIFCYFALALGRGVFAYFGILEAFLPSTLSLLLVTGASLLVAVLSGIASSHSRKMLKKAMAINLLSVLAAFAQNADSLFIGLVTALTVPAYYYMAQKCGRVFVLKAFLWHGGAYMLFACLQGVSVLLSEGGWVLISLFTSTSSLIVIAIILISGAYFALKYQLYLLPALTNGIVCFVFAPFGLSSLTFSATLAALAAISSITAGYCAHIVQLAEQKINPS